MSKMNFKVVELKESDSFHETRSSLYIMILVRAFFSVFDVETFFFWAGAPVAVTFALVDSRDVGMVDFSITANSGTR